MLGAAAAIFCIRRRFKQGGSDGVEATELLHANSTAAGNKERHHGAVDL
jgi:hypothetical protein